MSKGHYNKRYFGHGSHRSVRWGWFLGMMIILILALSSGLYFFRDKAQPIKSSFMAEIRYLKTWVLERKTKQQEALKSKATEGNISEEKEPIHFEFYTTLANGNSNVSAPSMPDAKKTAPAKPIFTSAESLEKDLAARIN